MKIADNSVVLIDYVLTDNDGEVIDSSEEIGALAYLHGADNIISGLEQALLGKEAGDKFKVSIAPKDAYGERVDDMLQQVPRDLFAGVEDIQVGMQFQSETDQGLQMVTVVDVADDEITVDGNHPMAGIDLHFDVIVRQVREATEAELQDGHPHTEKS